MNFEKTRGFIDRNEKITAEGIFDLFTCVLDDAYRMAGAEQIFDIPVEDEELYLKALSRVVFAINASVRENEKALEGAREGMKTRIFKAKEELIFRDDKLFSELRRMEASLSELKAQVEEKNLKLEALGKEKEELLLWGISAGNECRELSRDIEALTDKKSALLRELSQLEAKGKLIISCWNSLNAGKQGEMILAENQFKKIPEWFNKKSGQVAQSLCEMNDRLNQLILYSENLTR